MEKLHLRFIDHTDLKQACEIERQANKDIVYPWSLGEEGILSIIKQTKDELIGTYDTRTMVIELPVPCRDNQNYVKMFVCGAFAYELQPTGYELLYTLIHPDAPAGVLQLVSYFICGKADRSPIRRSVTMFLPDHDDAGIRTLIPFWTGKGFAVKLARGYFESMDAWQLTYQSEVPTNERNKHDEDNKKTC